MKILLQEDEKTRIVERFSTARAGFEYIVCRQRKRWYGWKTVAWLYTNQCDTIDEYVSHFDWAEKIHIQNMVKGNFRSSEEAKLRSNSPDF